MNNSGIKDQYLVFGNIIVFSFYLIINLIFINKARDRTMFDKGIKFF